MHALVQLSDMDFYGKALASNYRMECLCCYRSVLYGSMIVVITREMTVSNQQKPFSLCCHLLAEQVVNINILSLQDSVQVGVAISLGCTLRDNSHLHQSL